MYCPYCNSQNEDNAAICQFCRQRFLVEVDFEKPLEKLSRIANDIIRRDFPADPTLFDREFEQIFKDIQDALDLAVKNITDNISDINRFRDEGIKDYGQLNLETFDLLVRDFDEAQRKITEGLRDVEEHLIKARHSPELSTGFYKYSQAMNMIRDGVARVRTAMYKSSDMEAMTNPPEQVNMPKEIFRSRRHLEKAIKGIEAFRNTEDKRLIRYIIQKIERAHFMLTDLLYQLGELEKPEESEAEAEGTEVQGEADFVSPEEIAEARESMFEEGFDSIYKDEDWGIVMRKYREAASQWTSGTPIDPDSGVVISGDK